jgi:DNA primase
VGKAFSDDVLRSIRERIDLVELVGAYVALETDRSERRRLCPSTPTSARPSRSARPNNSFTASAAGGGDLFRFVMQRSRSVFPRRSNSSPGRRGPLPDRAEDGVDRRRQALYDIHAATADHFRRKLSGRGGEAARRYLHERRLAPETLEAFGLGYAASSWDDLSAALLAKGWTAAQLEEAGVIVPRASGGGWYDRFRHRVICPIRDVHRAVVAFGGRVLDNTLPKYLNSPDTPIFNKGRHLFGLDRAREAVASAGTLVVVEGYFDVMATHQAGCVNVVATLGTALTPAHLDAIRRLVTRVVLVFDPDPAGVRAALRTVDLFAPLDLRVDVARCRRQGSRPPGRRGGGGRVPSRVGGESPLDRVRPRPDGAAGGLSEYRCEEGRRGPGHSRARRARQRDRTRSLPGVARRPAPGERRVAP